MTGCEKFAAVTVWEHFYTAGVVSHVILLLMCKCHVHNETAKPYITGLKLLVFCAVVILFFCIKITSSILVSLMLCMLLDISCPVLFCCCILCKVQVLFVLVNKPCKNMDENLSHEENREVAYVLDEDAEEIIDIGPVDDADNNDNDDNDDECV